MGVLLQESPQGILVISKTFDEIYRQYLLPFNLFFNLYKGFAGIVQELLGYFKQVR